MQPHSHSDPAHDRKQPPPRLTPSLAGFNQQHPVLPPPDSLLAGAPSYASSSHDSSPDQRYHIGAHALTHHMPSPAGSTYSPHHQSHGQDQFRAQQAHAYSNNPQSSPYPSQGPPGAHHFSRPSGGQGHPHTPQRSAHRPQSSWIPNILGRNREQHIDTMQFSLVVRQQPRAARACGFGDRDRRVIDPPPIVQLKIDGPGLSEEEKRAYLRYSAYVMNCSIYDESGARDASYMPDEYQHQRRLMGSLVSTPFVGDDDQGNEGCFFCFSDLSCRTPGAFRLKFTLILLDPANAATVRHFPMLAEIKTDVFHVFSAKEFPGMVASSELAKRLKEQGCIISIKKGNERVRARGGAGRSDDEDD